MLKRFSISLEENLLAKFDKYIQRRKYNNRSEAIRDLIRNSFVKEEWDTGKDVFGIMSLVYDHHQPGIQEKITQIQHGFHKQVISATHIHIDHSNCLEVIVIQGKAAKVRELSEKLNALRGVKNGSLSMSSISGESQ